jgi:hypothetical protein
LSGGEGPDGEYVTGVEGIMNAYLLARQHIELYGPTNFSPLIRHIMDPLQRAYGIVYNTVFSSIHIHNMVFYFYWSTFADT